MNFISRDETLEPTKTYFYLTNPSKLFLLLSIIIFFLWLTLGPIYWREIDDYGPIEQLFLNKISFLDQIKHLPYWFWGSYPPIWHFWAFPSYIFKNLNIDITRYILLIQGYISVVLLAYLTSALSQIIIINNKNYNPKKEKNVRYLSDSLSLIILGFNPQIMLHSMTYMPYQLGLISSLLTTIYFNNKLFIDTASIVKKQNYFKISEKKLIFFTFISYLFIFQSFFIFIPSIIFSLILLDKRLITTNIFKLKKLFSSRKEKFLFTLALLLFISYLRKFIILYIGGAGAGKWAYGIDNIFRLNDKNIDFFSYLNKIFFSTINIFSQSLFPYKENQIFFGYLIFILVLISFFKLRNSTKIFKFTFSFYFLNYIFTIFLSTYTSINFSPTRHNIYLFPLPILSVILITLDFYIKNIKIKKINNVILISIMTSSLFLFFNGLNKSHKLIQYTKNDREKMILMAQKADYFLDLSHNKILGSPGFFQSHGNKEFNALRNKECTAEKIKESNSKSYTIFYYSNGEIFDFNDLEAKDYLIKYSRDCLTKNSSLKILEKIEIANKNGTEQNNFIINPMNGSNLNAYIIKVDY